MLAATRMRPSARQTAPIGSSTCASVTTWPSGIDTFFSSLPAKNATQRPSGEKTGLKAASVPGTGVTVSLSSSRWYSCVVVPRRATYTRLLPSGASASEGRPTPQGATPTNASAAESGRTISDLRGRALPLVSDRCQPNQPKAAASAAIVQPAIATKSQFVRGSRRPRNDRPDGRSSARSPAGSNSAREKSVADRNRSAGSLASAFETAASTWGGTVSRKCLTGRGGSMTVLVRTAFTVEATCSGSPVSISYRTAPNE